MKKSFAFLSACVFILIVSQFTAFGGTQTSIAATTASQKTDRTLTTAYNEQETRTEPSPVYKYSYCIANQQSNVLTGIFPVGFAIFDRLEGGNRIWGPEVIGAVALNGGCFDVVLGRSIPFPPAIANDPLYLEISVDGSKLEKRIPVEVKEVATREVADPMREDVYSVTNGILAPAPTTTDYGINVRNEKTLASRGIYAGGTEYGLYAEETGTGDVGVYSPDYIVSAGYRSKNDSYMWFPGGLAVTTSYNIILDYTVNGAVRVKLSSINSSSDKGHIYLPLAVPSMLFGQTVKIEELRIYYKCNSMSGKAFISTNRLVKQTGATSSVDLVVDNTDYESMIDASYYLYPDPQELNMSQGILSLYLYMTIPNTLSSITIGGVRVRLGHI